jgi:DNA polymerase I-like protein with 3'-5' exonuclease and polymerase domains
MRLIAFDFETSGTLREYALQPWRALTRQGHAQAWVTSLAVVRQMQTIASGIDGCNMISGKLDPTVEDMCEFLETAIEWNYRIVGWNTTFDISWLLAYGLEELVFKCKWLDGMRLWRHFFLEPEYDTTRQNKKSYGLKRAVEEFLPHMAGYEQDVDFHDTSPEARAKLQKYNEDDTVATLLITEHLWGLLTPEQRRCALIEADCLPMVALANLRGMLVDTIATRELQTRLVGDATDMLEKLAPHGVTEKVIRSPLQLSKLMFDVWGLPVLKENESAKTGKISRSTDKEVLHELAFVDPRAADLRLYREALGNKAKFADAVLASVAYNEDGCTHPEAIVFGTYSGRFTYSSKQSDRKSKPMRELQTGFAIHQMKRQKRAEDANFKYAIIPPPGYTLMEFDAAGQEFKWMAIASGDETMLGLCVPGEDPHSYMAAAIYSEEYHRLVEAVGLGDKAAKERRQLGKVANLSLQYRTGWRKLRSVARVEYEIPMEEPEARFVHKTYPRTYPRVPNYWGMQIRQTRVTGYVETFAGRRVQVTGNWDGDMGWSMGSTAINYRIQGTGADQKYLALSVIRSYLVSIGAYFAWDLHDGIYLYVPHEKVQRAALDIKHLLDNLPYEKAWGFKPPIALPWDCKTGPSWGAVKEYKFDV